MLHPSKVKLQTDQDDALKGTEKGESTLLSLLTLKEVKATKYNQLV